MKNMTNKIAVVFGSEGGIGEDICRKLILSGFNVKRFDKKLGNDILDEKSVIDFVKDSSFVVNCVGIMSISPIEELSVEEFNKTCEVNLTGSFIVAKACKINKVKNLVLISSNSGLSGFSNMAAYCASKFGVIGLMQTAAKEMASYGGICNAICPSALKYGQTEMTKVQGEKFMKSMKLNSPEELDKALSSRIPLKRLCDVKDISEWVRFLATMESDFFTGQIISLTGGMNMVK
jgi:NAD(P)-dependent dehydrogenase (short-subunit alcohol dehydrogenase family)